VKQALGPNGARASSPGDVARVPDLLDEGIVRTRLIERLLASTEPVVSVVAPPGYGKTSLVSQWVGRDERPSVWVNIEGPEDRGALAIAMASAQSLDPILVVIDDVDRLRDPELLQELDGLAGAISAGSQLVLVGHRCPLAGYARLRAEDRALEIGVEDLRMDAAEAVALVRRLGGRASDEEVTRLMDATQGWPIALHLLADVGDDRAFAEFVRTEILGTLTGPQRRFVERASVLPWLSGPACVAALGAKSSARTLRSLEWSSVPMTPIGGDRLVFHPLFRSVARSELDVREPDAAGAIGERASAWYERDGAIEAAIETSQAAGDVNRVAELTVRDAIQGSWADRIDLIHERLGWIRARTPLDRYPFAAAIGGFLHLVTGNVTVIDRLIGVVSRGPLDAIGPDGSTLRAWLHTLRAARCGDGFSAMRAHSAAALRELAAGSPWRGTASLALGMACLHAGDLDEADRALADAAEEGAESSSALVVSMALAERSMVAMRRGQWATAEELTARARAIVADAPQAMGIGALAFVASALLAIHRGDTIIARDDLRRVEVALENVPRAVPTLSVDVRIQAARAYIALEDAERADLLLDDAEDALRRCPGAGELVEDIEAVRNQLEARREGSLRLTAAEHRLLPLLATHLSFREIGEQLYLSPHTVKAEAISIYRKLQQTSRNGAVTRARELGLLDR
jgi:LuxR family maltose regulon positive regulatory protein